MRKSVIGALVLSAIFVPNLVLAADAFDPAEAEAMVGGWDSECSPQGCIMMRHAIIGDSDHPVDPENPEAVTILLAIERGSHNTALMLFYMPPDADPSQGLTMAFSRTLPDGDSWRMELDKNATLRLPITECTEQNCLARTANGIVTAADGAPVNLVDRFQDYSHVLFGFFRNGEFYRSMDPLFVFKRDYTALLNTELRKQE